MVLRKVEDNLEEGEDDLELFEFGLYKWKIILKKVEDDLEES